MTERERVTLISAPREYNELEASAWAVGYDAATAKADARIKELEVLLPPKLTETLTHERNCPAWHDAFGLEIDAENCTCGYKWRVYLQTEQQMHNAWRKRAEEAEIKIEAAPPIPADKVMVPREPTTAMWLAGQDVATYMENGEVTCMSGQQVEAIYKAMIAAKEG